MIILPRRQVSACLAPLRQAARRPRYRLPSRTCATCWPASARRGSAV